MFEPDVEAVAARRGGSMRPDRHVARAPPMGAPLPMGVPPMGSPPPGVPPSGPLSRVPSHLTIMPGPVLAIDLAVLAAHISPNYSVEELKAALVRSALQGPEGEAAAQAPAPSAQEHLPARRVLDADTIQIAAAMLPTQQPAAPAAPAAPVAPVPRVAHAAPAGPVVPGFPPGDYSFSRPGRGSSNSLFDEDETPFQVPQSTSQRDARRGHGDRKESTRRSFRVTANKDLSTLRVAPLTDALGTPASAPTHSATPSMQIGHGDRRTHGQRSFVAVTIPVESEPPSEATTPAPSRPLSPFLPGPDGIMEDGAETVPSSWQSLATSLTRVPGTTLEGHAQPQYDLHGEDLEYSGRERYSGDYTDVEDTPLSEYPIGAVAVGSSAFPGSMKRDRAAGNVLLNLPPRATDVLTNDPETTALVIPMAKKPRARSTLSSPDSEKEHLLLLADAAPHPDFYDFDVDHGAAEPLSGSYAHALRMRASSRHAGPGTLPSYGSISPKPLPPPSPVIEEAPQPTTSTVVPRMMNIEPKLKVRETEDSGNKVDLLVKFRVNWFGYLTLGIAILSVASQGPAVKSIKSIPGPLQASWLMQTQSIVMFFAALMEFVKVYSDEKKRPRFSWSLLQQVIMTSVWQVMWAAGFFVVVPYTALSRAWVLNNSHSVLIVFLALFHGRATDRGEVWGAQIALLGALIMEVPVIWGGRSAKGLFADFCAVGSSLAAMQFLESCKVLRMRLPLFCMMFPVGVSNSILFSIMAILWSGSDLSRTDQGVFGWFTWERAFVGLYLGVVVGFIGTLACISALDSLPSVVVSVAQSLMPPVGVLIAVCMGIDDPPDWATSIGVVVAVWGVIEIAKAAGSRQVVVTINQQKESA